MHICPQEIMMLAQSVEMARPLLTLAAAWCSRCVSGEHKSCEDHANDVRSVECEEAT